MANCPRCGAPLSADSQFCVNCGANVMQNAASGASNGAVDRVVGFFKALNNTTDYTMQCNPNDAGSNQVMGILAYIPLLFLIPYFAAKNSVFAKFHANQGLLCTIVLLALGLVNTVIGLIVGLIFGIGSIIFLQVIGDIICWIIGIASAAIFLYFMIIGIINAANRKLKELPLIGSFRLIK